MLINFAVYMMNLNIFKKIIMLINIFHNIFFFHNNNHNN